MKEQASNVLKAIVQFWKSQSKKNKILYISVLAGIVVIAIVLSLVLNQKNYVVLYTGLDSAEAGQILTEIQAMKIDAQIQANGTITVPKDQENSLRMQLATKGYPKSALSYDIWNNGVNMFTTDSQKKEIAKMQLQERLQATIKTLSCVEDAIVTLDIPETSNTVISTNTKKPSASVVVHIKDGESLSASQIKGISTIVLKSISGLEMDNVSITDGDGRPLTTSDAGSSDSVSTDKDRLKFKQDFEGTIKKEILGLLQPAYGANGVNVSVNAVFNYDKKVTDHTQYTPSVGDKGMVEHEDTSSSTGNNGSSGGVPGVDSNADETYPTGNSSSNGSWSESSNNTSYLVNTLKEQTEKQGYYVDKVNVSLTVYSNDLSATDKAKLINTVAKAAGTPPELISVENFPLFNTKPGEIPTITPNKYFGYTFEQILLMLAVIFVVVLILIIIIVAASRGKKKPKNQLTYVKAGGGQAPVINEQPQVDIRKLTDRPPDTKEAAIRHEIGDFSKNSPEIAAQLLKSWLREDGD